MGFAEAHEAREAQVAAQHQAALDKAAAEEQAIEQFAEGLARDMLQGNDNGNLAMLLQEKADPELAAILLQASRLRTQHEREIATQRLRLWLHRNASEWSYKQARENIDHL